MRREEGSEVHIERGAGGSHVVAVTGNGGVERRGVGSTKVPVWQALQKDVVVSTVGETSVVRVEMGEFGRHQIIREVWGIGGLHGEADEQTVDTVDPE